MHTCDAVIVGGGPAGSTCGRALSRAGWNVIIFDRAPFPRDKPCAGWITPDVLSLLGLDAGSYRDAGLVLQGITAFRTGLLGRPTLATDYRLVVSYGIRRCEFDTHLLRRCGARVVEGRPVASFRRDGADWIVNEEIRTPFVIGAGGHFCPVARQLRQPGRGTAVVAREAEFPLDGRRSTVRPGVPELFFCADLEGYGWCVRKGEYLNVGIGRRTSDGFNRHVEAFARLLEETGRAPGARREAWRGHAYLASGVDGRRLVDAGLLLVGDAAGVAYPESGEGIRPAIESALLAADTLIAAGGSRRIDDLLPYQTALERRHPAVPHTAPFRRRVHTVLGRALLRSRAFTRHVLLDRWFLRV